MQYFTRSAWSILAMVALVGCQGPDTSPNSKMTDVAPTNTELAAYAGAHAFPTTRPTHETKVAAIISADRSALHLYNFGNEALSPVDVWVNRAYVVHLRGIPANGSVIVKTADLYNALGKSFASQSDPIGQVNLLTPTEFYNVMGPVAQ